MTERSPSQTGLFIRCPMRWALKYLAGIEPVEYDDQKIVPILGQAWGHATSQLYLSLANGVVTSSQDYVKAGLDYFDRETAQLLVAEKLKKRAQLAGLLEVFTKANPIPTDSKILHVEGMLGDDEYAPRIDLGGQDHVGDWFIYDLKLKLYKRESEVDGTLQEYDRSWQMLDYLRRYSRSLGVAVRRFRILLGVLGPKPIVVEKEFEVTERDLEVFERQADFYWTQMDILEAGYRHCLTDEAKWKYLVSTVPMSGEHYDRYNPIGSSYKCKWFDACWTFSLERDAILSSGRFINIERRSNAASRTEVPAV